MRPGDSGADASETRWHHLCDTPLASPAVSQLDTPEDRSLIGRIAAEASDRVLDFVDPNLVLDHIDLNALLERVDVNALLDRVDVDALLERADIDALMERVDLKALVDRAGIPEIVAESTSHLTGSALDLLRRPIVGLDEILFRFLNRIIGRNPDEFPSGPSDLVTWVDLRKDDEEGSIKTGRYAGPLTRLLAVIVDGFAVAFGFTLIVSGVTFLVQLFASDFEFSGRYPFIFGGVFILWAFVYKWFSLAVFGKTLGKALLGVRVVSSDGNVVLNRSKPFVRTLTYPLSFAFFGLGLIGIIWSRERRAWHDHFAGTAVVYDWGSRTAAMPTPLAKYLERKQEEEE